ncbi:MAG: hypothetical protein DWI63_03125, partial [Chloroflexi bacterium]
MHTSRLLRALLLGSAALAAGACTLAGDVTPPPGFVPFEMAVPVALAAGVDADAANGARLYAQHCTACHGAGGAGDGELAANLPGPLPNFTDAQFAALREPQAWFNIISNGNLAALMPPWKDRLSVQERWDLVAHLYSLSGNSARVPAAVAPAEAKETVRVQGRVVNATRSAAPTAGTLLTLVTADAQGTQRELQTATDRAGNFVFDAVQLAPDARMEVRAEHEGVKYASSTIPFEPGRADYQLDVAIYDSTAALAAVELAQLHFILEQQAEALLVTQVAVLRNTGNRTVAPLEAPLLALRLPAGAMQAQLRTDQSWPARLTPAGVELGTALLPAGAAEGTAQQVVVSYFVPAAALVSIVLPLDFPVRSVTVSVPAGQLRVTGAGAQPVGEHEVNPGVRMQVMQLVPPAPGAALQFGLEAVAAGGMRTETLLTLAAAVCLLAVGAALVAVLLRLLRARRAPRTLAQAAAGRDKLLRIIAHLDDSYALGELS